MWSELCGVDRLIIHYRFKRFLNRNELLFHMIVAVFVHLIFLLSVSDSLKGACMCWGGGGGVNAQNLFCTGREKVRVCVAFVLDLNGHIQSLILVFVFLL